MFLHQLFSYTKCWHFTSIHCTMKTAHIVTVLKGFISPGDVMTGKTTGKSKRQGQLRISIEGRVLRLYGEGPWNTESLQLKDKRIMEQVHSLYGSPWGVLAEFKGEAVYVPEAAEKLRKQITNEVKLGRIATAVVLESPKAPQLTKFQLSAAYRANGHEVEFFDTSDDAAQWLQTKLAALQTQA